MNEERLAFLKGAAVHDYTRGEFLDEALCALEDARAGNEWLTTLLGRALVYVDEASMPASWELGDAIRLAISKEAAL